MANIEVPEANLTNLASNLVVEFCPIATKYLDFQSMVDDVVAALRKIISDYNQCPVKQTFNLSNSCDRNGLGRTILVGLRTYKAHHASDPETYGYVYEILRDHRKDMANHTHDGVCEDVAAFLSGYGMAVEK